MYSHLDCAPRHNIRRVLEISMSVTVLSKTQVTAERRVGFEPTFTS